MGWITGLLGLLVEIARVLYGTSKPTEVVLHEEPTPPSLRPSERDVLESLGLRVEPGVEKDAVE